MVKVIFALIFLQFPSFVIASECPTTNLMDSSPISKRSDLGQSGMGWCCSYAFTDALSIKAGFNVSPVDIGITQARFTGKTASCYPLEEVLESIQKSNGLCREEDYLSNSSAEILISTSNPFHSSIVKYSDRFRFANQYAIEELKRIFDFLQEDPQKFDEACVASTERLNPFFSNIRNLKDIAEIIQTKVSKDFQEFLYNLAQKNCSARTTLEFSYEKIPLAPDDSEQKSSASSFNSVKQRLIAALQEQRSPVLAVDIPKLFDSNMGLFRRIGSVIGGSHAVNIVASREIDGKCYFKVRDSSFGGSDCRLKKGKSIICSAVRDGTYEIEVEELLSAVRSIVVLK